MNYQTTSLKESENKTVKLDNQEVSVAQFNETVNNLKSNQRIIETGDHDFHLVERLYD